MEVYCLIENLSRRIVPFIQNSFARFNTGGVALAWNESMIVSFVNNAIDNGYIITTQDADFYEMSLNSWATTEDCLAQDGQSIENGDYQNLARQSTSH